MKGRVLRYKNCLLKPSPAEPGYALPLQNSVDPDQLVSEEKPTDLYLHYLSLIM